MWFCEFFLLSTPRDLKGSFSGASIDFSDAASNEDFTCREQRLVRCALGAQAAKFHGRADGSEASSSLRLSWWIRA